MNLMQLPDAKRQVSEEKREQRTKHNRFQIKGHDSLTGDWINGL